MSQVTLESTNSTNPVTFVDDAHLVGIGEASELLGLSRTSVQKLVDEGRLAAIKTLGGHRRIERASLMSLREEMHRSATAPAPLTDLPAPSQAAARPASASFEILLVDDDPVSIELMRALIGTRFPQVTLSVAQDGVEAVLQLERRRPDLVVTDLMMEPFNGFRLAWLVHDKPEYRAIHLLVVTGLAADEIVRRGGLPGETVVYQKPLSTERFLGFMEGHIQARRRKRA
jgi:excisionase family DNA binding protein